MEELNLDLYALRHGGASHDFLMQTRSLVEIKKRGRWGSDLSVKRYQKASRALAELKKVPKATQALGHHVEQHLAELFRTHLHHL